MNNSQLSRHKKEEHKSIDNNSSTSIKCFPLVDELSLLDLTGSDVIERPLIEDLISCELCEVELDSKVELEKHMQIAHEWRCITTPSTESQQSLDVADEKVNKDVTEDIAIINCNQNILKLGVLQSFRIP